METTRNNSLDAALLTPEEKQALHAAELPPPTQAPTQRKKGFRPHILVALIVTGVLALGATAGPRMMTNCLRHHARPSDASFAQLLHSTDPESLRQALADRLPEKYVQGAFASDVDALEAVHEDDAELATKLVKLAARQDDESSPTDDDDKPTSTKDEDSTTVKPTETKTDDDDDDDDSSTTVKPTETSSSKDDDETTSDDDGTSSTESPSKRPSETPTRSSTAFPTSSEEQDSSTDDDDSKTSEAKTTKVTNSDGAVATITSYANADPTDQADDDEEEGNADLQDAGARPAVALLSVLGAAAGALLML